MPQLPGHTPTRAAKRHRATRPQTSRHDAIPAAGNRAGAREQSGRVEEINSEWSTGASFIYRTVPWLTLGWNWAILSRDETQRGLVSSNHAAPRRAHRPAAHQAVG